MRWLVTIALVVFCVFQTIAAVQDSEAFSVEGLKTNFTMQVSQQGWVGGNYYQIAEAANDPAFGKPRVVQLLEALKDEAKSMDAVLLYLIDPGEIVPCMIRVHPAKPAGGMTADKFTADWGHDLADALQKDEPPGSVAELKYYMGSDKHRVGGRPAVRMLIEVTRAKRGRYVHVVDLVVLGQQIQMFTLKCDERLSQARVPEYEAMLRTVKYR